MKNLFYEVRQNRMCEDVVEQIQTAILEGAVAPGEKLPAQQELCDRFQVSGETLQKAFGILEQKSLIEVHRENNGEASVRDADAGLMAENLAMLIRSQRMSLEHLAEFREGVEGAVTGLAAQRSTAADNTRLTGLLDQAAQWCEKGSAGWNGFVEVDEKIHIEIARIAGNPLYNFVLRSIHDNIHRYYDKYLIVGEMEIDENFQDLRLLVEAVAQHDAVMAQKVAVEHVRRFSRYMEQKKRQEPEF
ncbi:MAG: FadR/GntR family transcriptional regulator [Desulfopila sp.]